MIVTYATESGTWVLILDDTAEIDVEEWEVGPRAAHAGEMGRAA